MGASCCRMALTNKTDLSSHVPPHSVASISGVEESIEDPRFQCCKVDEFDSKTGLSSYMLPDSVASVSGVEESMEDPRSQCSKVDEIDSNYDLIRKIWMLGMHSTPEVGQAEIYDNVAPNSGIKESMEDPTSYSSEVSEVDEFDFQDKFASDNVEVFRILQGHPTWGDFFMTFGEGEGSRGALVVGKKFAEGGEAEIYDVQIEWHDLDTQAYFRERCDEHVLKVYKRGTFLRDLQHRWPQGMLQHHVDVVNRKNLGLSQSLRHHSDILGGTLLEDGRFAFLLAKEQEDLRTLIDRRLSTCLNDEGPLSREEAMEAMYGIARGMKQLHDRGIVHRDLKSCNVFISKKEGCHVGDFESSVGVVGTGFWRAPEILQAIKDRNIRLKPKLFSEASDVYSYGMTCYEIFTGKIPFKGFSLNDFDLVINGRRPEVPQYVDGWIRELLSRCWHSNPASRPSFGEILGILVANSPICWGYSLRNEERELDLGICKVPT